MRGHFHHHDAPPCRDTLPRQILWPPWGTSALVPHPIHNTLDFASPLRKTGAHFLKPHLDEKLSP
jgi:hypothetical protein